MDHDRRGVSAPLGIALLFAIVIAGMVVVVTVGATTLDDTRHRMDVERSEKVLTQFDSMSAMVALGKTESQSVALSRSEGAGFYVRDESGWMNVSIRNTTSDTHEELVNVTLGAVTYENEDDTLAYQGGGVWKRTESGATMVSPPEFHFRDATLTLPIIRVDGDASLGSHAEISRNGPTSIQYPNATNDPDFVNPLENGRVNVTVHSDYYEAWGSFFEQRARGNVTYDDRNQTANIELVVPFNKEFDNVLATTASGGITINGNDPRPSPAETGVNYPSADRRIEDQIAACETDDAACDDSTAFDDIDAPGTYYEDSGFGGDLDVNTSDGNVTVVVNGGFSPDSISVTGGNSTTVLVRHDFDINSNSLNDGGGADALTVSVHSDGEVDMNGNAHFVGLVYAPLSHCDMNGNAYVQGGAVCETVDINGNPNEFHYDSSVEETNLRLAPEDITKITYLHVTTNSVNVTSG